MILNSNFNYKLAKVKDIILNLVNGQLQLIYLFELAIPLKEANLKSPILGFF